MLMNRKRLIDKVKTIGRKYRSIIFLPSITRISLDNKLIPILQQLEQNKNVLEIGSSSYEVYRKHIKSPHYHSLDIVKHDNVDIVGDIHNLDWDSDYFDIILGIEILEHLYDPKAAVQQVLRLLKPGGICVITTRFMFPYHPCDKDYYRFTKDSLADLFKGFSSTQIQHHGNGIQVFWQMITYKYPLLLYPLRLLNPIVAMFESKATVYPSGFLVTAKK